MKDLEKLAASIARKIKRQERDLVDSFVHERFWGHDSSASIKESKVRKLVLEVLKKKGD